MEYIYTILKTTFWTNMYLLVPKDVISLMIKDASLIPDKRLSDEVHEVMNTLCCFNFKKATV